jgi:hypothetical protein
MAVTPACPLCANAVDNLTLESRRNVPTLQNITFSSAEDARQFRSGNLEIVWCRACGLIWNAAFDASAVVYDKSYNNDVAKSAYYAKHLEAIAERVIGAVPLDRPIRLVEVGCGSGDFLRLVVERAAGRCQSATGFDPSSSDAGQLPAPIVIHREHFGPASLARLPSAANVICSRHTIEQVPDPKAFMATLAAPVIADSRIRLLLEGPDADWILRHLAFQDFSYERFWLFAPAPMRRLLAAFGLDCTIETVYDGQYMWVDAVRAGQRSPSGAPENDETTRLQLALTYIEKSQTLLAKWRDYVDERTKDGPVALWGASSKGVTFSHLLAQAGAGIDCAIDLNPAKQGRFMPVTAVPIVAPETAMKGGVETVVIMNPNYRAEITAIAAQMGWNPKFADLTPDDRRRQADEHSR